MTPDLNYSIGRARVNNANITINGMGKRKEKTCISAAVINHYPSKLHGSIRSGLTAVLSNWSMYNFSDHTQRTWSVTFLAPHAQSSKNIKKKRTRHVSSPD